MPKKPSGQDVLAFWFTETPPEFWFKKDAEFDARIADQFARTVEVPSPAGVITGQMTAPGVWL